MGNPTSISQRMARSLNFQLFWSCSEGIPRHGPPLKARFTPANRECPGTCPDYCFEGSHVRGSKRAKGHTLGLLALARKTTRRLSLRYGTRVFRDREALGHLEDPPFNLLPPVLEAPADGSIEAERECRPDAAVHTMEQGGSSSLTK